MFNRAAACNLNEPAAVTVATVDAHGRPSARVVLLKGYDASGFVFYTNMLSRKGHELAANPRVAMCFFWDPLMEQVRVEGHVSPVTDAEADAYWNGRHPGSQLGAWASDQSEPLESRETLEARVGRIRRAICRRPRPASAALVGLPGGADTHRVLVLPPEPSARAHLLLARWRRVAGLPAQSVSTPWALG